MRGRSLLLTAFAVFIATAASVFAASQPVDRVRVADVGGALTADLPPTVFVSLAPPADYVRNAASAEHGDWTGPEYWASGKRDQGGRASISWTIRFDNRSPGSEAAARAGLIRSWGETLHGGVSVPHVVLGRQVGTIDGDFVLAVAAGASNASHELAMAFAVAPHLYAVVDFLLTSPAASSAGAAGEYLVLGSIPASTWNRGQALRAMTGVHVEGNLPPTRISAKATSDGRVLHGILADAFRHPVIRTPVMLESLRAGSWRKVTSTRTDFTGAYSIRIGRRAEYRVVAGLGTASIASVAVRAGRPQT